METEKEQLARIKLWVRENGISIILGVVLGLAGVYGWRAWQDYRVEDSKQVFGQILAAGQAIDGKDYDKGVALSRTLVSEEAGEAAADLARLMLARAHIEQGYYDAAIVVLQEVIDKPGISALSYVARLRQARIYIANSEWDKAGTVLPDSFPDSFAADVAELRGDIALGKGDKKLARAQYENALALASDATDTDFLKMKIDDTPL